MTDTVDPVEPAESSNFIRWLRDHLDGDTLNELDEGFSEIIAATDISGRKTMLTLKIDADKKGRTVVVKTDVATKIPPPPREADIFYPDNNGHLHREDPSQPKLTFAPNVVPIDSSEPRRVADANGEIKTLPETGDSQ